MSSTLILTEPHPGGVTLLRLNRPPLNPLSHALLSELGETVLGLAGDPACRALVITGNEKALAAGADIAELEASESAQRLAEAFRHAFDAVAAFPHPVLCAIRGFALGGGLELALACDLRIVGTDARLGLPETTLGILPGAGGTQRLTRLVGPARAKRIIWSGKPVRPEEAHTIGLVDEVVEPEAVETRALELATAYATAAARAIGLAKRAIDEGLDIPLAEGLDLENEAFTEVLTTNDAKIGIASFLEHGPGKATYTGT